MVDAKFCAQCGAPLTAGAQVCDKCGAKVGNLASNQRSPKSAITALLLCIFLGGLGIHRFYVGKIGTGILMILTMGGLGIWTLVDLVMIASCAFTDSQGRELVFEGGKTSTTKRVLLILVSIFAVFLIFIGLIIFIAFKATGGLVASVEGQLDAIRAHDIAKAYSYNSKAFQDATSLNDFENFVASVPALKDNVSATFPQRNFENDDGYVKGKLTSKDGTKTIVEYDLKYENGAWKIMNIHALPESESKDKNVNENDT